MEWDEASDEIWNRFCELDDESQIDIVENSASGIVKIFPTKHFNDFCKKEFKGDYKRAAQAVLDGYDYDMDLSAPWCMYDESGGFFRTAETPSEFVDNEDALVGDLMDNEDILSDMGFSEDEIEEFHRAYEEE